LLNVQYIDETGTQRRLAKEELTVFLAVVALLGKTSCGQIQ
jgi:hypothetical protein